MGHIPQHPHNPCSLDENEQTPAKIWELLRRNEKVRRAFNKLKKWDAEEGAQKIHGFQRASYRIVKALEKSHGFAAVAFQWLVPEPEFRADRVALPQTLDSTGFVALEVIAEGHGATPDPNDNANWHWEDLTTGRPRGAVGEVFLRGPVIFRRICEDSRFSSKVDPFQEWRDYFEVNRRNFTLETSWRDAPPGFRRHFCQLWRQRDSSAVSPDTGLRRDAPEPQKIDFFQNWHLGRTLVSACETGQLNLEDLARTFQFQELADDYHIFAIPKSIRSRMAARQISDWLIERLAANLPARKPEFLGSPLQWDIFLTVLELMRAGAPFDEALQESFEKLFLHADDWYEGQPMPDQKKGWAQRGADWQNSYRVMDAPVTSTGLIQQIFPRKSA